jgi:hypothetical protein
MDVAGTGADGIEQDTINQMADFDGLFGGLRLEILQRVVHLISEPS